MDLAKHNVEHLRALWALPKEYNDYSNVCAQFSKLAVGSTAVLLGCVDGPINRRNSPPRSEFSVADRAGNHVRVTIFGPAAEPALCTGDAVAIYGSVSQFRGARSLVGTLVDREDVGLVKPKYLANGRALSPERQSAPSPGNVDANAESSAQWAANLVGIEALSKILKCAREVAPSRLAELIRETHQPETVASGLQARHRLEIIAASATIAQLQAQSRPMATFLLNEEQGIREIEDLACSLPFQLTGEQRQSCLEAIADMASGQAMMRLLQGDVGSGKTAAYGLVAAITAYQHGCVGILCPTQPLAEQVYEELSGYWPEIEFQLVRAGDRQRRTPWPGVVFVGTTALFAQLEGSLDLTIVDEQHKYSVRQRERLATSGGHLLEVSGTCIPRSLALATIGHQSVSELRGMHCKKDLRTYLLGRDHQRKLFQRLQGSISDGEKLLVVCAKRDDESEDDRGAVTTAAKLWERRFPGQVQLLHGQMSDAEKAEALAAVKSGRRPILVSTSVIEVGITIPNLRWMMIMDPDRFGLVQLHQIRGRLARQGGTGYCVLYKNGELSAEAVDRLKVFCSTTDGFKLAQADMALRGAGDILGGVSQHGKTPSPLLPEKHHCSLQSILQAAEILAA